MAFRDRNDNDSLENKGRFNIFSWMTRDGAGVEPGEEPVMKNPSVKNFFKLFGRKFNQIITLNLMMIAGNFPIFFLFAMMTGYFSINTASPAYTLFAQLNGALGSTPSAYSAALFGSYSIQTPLTVLSTVDYVLIALSCLVLFTFGPVMVGSSYIMRNMVRQEPIFMKHDFFYAIKRNLKQSVIFGIMDVAIIFFIIYDIFFFNLNFSQSMAMKMMFFAAIFIAILYFFMRMYIYIMMLTFDLSIFKLLKNALIFTVLGIKRNACALIGTLAAVLLNFWLLAVYFPIGVILPFIITLSFTMFISAYCAYPVISKYMIEPYYGDDAISSEAAEESAE